MPVNMHYCRFENTLKALLECQDDILDESESESEERSRKRLLQVINRIASELDD